MTMPQCIGIADRRAASRRTTVHSTPALSANRWRPARFPAPRRGPAAGCSVIGKFSCCIALVRQFLMARHTGRDRTDDRLSTGVDMNVLDCDALLTLATPTIERLGQSGEGPREFTRLVQALAPTIEALPVNCG